MSGFTATVNTLAAVTAVEQITNINNAVNGFVWGLPMLILLVGTGILMTLLTKFFQITHIRHWFSKTIGAVFTDRHVTAHTAKDDKSISQFQSLCTALRLRPRSVPVISRVSRRLSSRADPERSSGCGSSLSSE